MGGHSDLRIRIARDVLLFQTGPLSAAVGRRRQTPSETRHREPVGHWLSRGTVFLSCMGGSKRSSAERFAGIQRTAASPCDDLGIGQGRGRLMSFQAGVFYFDGRPVPGRESAAIVRGLGPVSTLPAVQRRCAGLFQAHAALSLDSQEANVAQPFVAEGVSITFDGRLDNREDLLLSMQDGLRGETCDVLLALAAYQRRRRGWLPQSNRRLEPGDLGPSARGYCTRQRLCGSQAFVLLRPRRTCTLVDSPEAPGRLGSG